MLLKEEKAQTALEMLLILAGAVFMASLVGVYLKNLPQDLVNDTIPTEQDEIVTDLSNL